MVHLHRCCDAFASFHLRVAKTGSESPEKGPAKRLLARSRRCQEAGGDTHTGEADVGLTLAERAASRCDELLPILGFRGNDPFGGFSEGKTEPFQRSLPTFGLVGSYSAYRFQ